MTLRFNYTNTIDYCSEQIPYNVFVEGSGNIDFDLDELTSMYFNNHNLFNFDEAEAFLYEYFGESLVLGGITFDDLDVDTIIEYIKDYYENRN